MTKDYDDFLKECGLSEKIVYAIAINMEDHIDFPKDYSIERKLSNIAGYGMFTTRKFRAWEMICPGRIFNKRTLAGRGINHSDNPNTVCVRFENDLYFVAKINIIKDEELTADYRQVGLINSP